MIINYMQITRFGLPVRIIQRLGVDAEGAALVVDGVAGERTRGARYLNPQGPHIGGVSAAIAELLAGAEEMPVLIEGRELRGNRGPWVSKYYLRALNDLRDHGAWCAAFVGWCLQQDLGDGAPYSWSARRLLARCQDQSQAPRLGAVVCWERASAGPYNGHVGIVAHIEDDGTIWAIEGNTSVRGAVRAYRWAPPYTRAVDKLIGFGVPL